MTSDLRARLSRSRLTGFILAASAILLIGLLLGLPALADPEQPVPPPGRGYGSGSGSLSLPAGQRLTGEPIRVSLSAAGWTTVLSENFEGTWPSTNWYVFDNDSPPSTNGEYYWAKRNCLAHAGSYSAWGIGGGANGSSLACGASYPNLANSWMVYGPIDLSQATAVELSFYFWLNSECDGTNCANAKDPLWVIVSTDGQNFDLFRWLAGDWYLDGWVNDTLNLNTYTGQPQVWIGFLFESDSSVTYPGGAYVDDVLVRAYTTGPTPTPTTCPATAYIQTLSTDNTCYRPGTQIGVFVDVRTSLPSQSVRVEATLWSGDIIWSPAEQTFTAPGTRVIPLQVPADLFPGDYVVVARVFDANTNCFQDSAQRTIRVDPVCGTVTPTATATATRTPTRTPTPTATVTCTPVLEATLCPGQSITETKHIFIPPAPGRADVLFAFDASGSMSDEINSARTNAISIMNNLAGLIPDVQFGVMDFLDYPISPYGGTSDHAYLLRQAITSDRNAVQTAMNAITTGWGDDGPEAYSRALYESYSDSTIGWRTDARRFVVMFGDSVAHDDDLNAGVPSPPYLPGQQWRTGYAPSYLDPGRDGQPGTADDLDFQTALNGMRTNGVTLLFVTSAGGLTEGPNLDGMVTYWQNWAGRTGAGGSALKLDNAANLPTVIQNLVTSASRRISRLELIADPSSYQSWLTVNPPAYTDLDVPAGGITVPFAVDIRVPPGSPLGMTHSFAIKAMGDGARYGGQCVVINVPTWCATATPTPTATRTPTRTPTRTLTPTPTPTQGGFYWKPGGWLDYAPSGLPDFDQRQDNWRNPKSNNWSYCGPLALANCLWWFDSKMEPNPATPPTINDNYPLVQSYSPGQWDDHDPRNLPPFVADLAWRMDTDGQRTGGTWEGTYVSDMYNAVRGYLSDHGLADAYTVTMVEKPTFDWVADEVERCEDVILLLGFWTQGPTGWQRVGGHFVTVAGVEQTAWRIAFSNPIKDSAESGWPGRVLNGTLISHTPVPGHAYDVHNDAGNISHDIYNAVSTDSPGGLWGPASYVDSAAAIANFFGQNFPRDFPEKYMPQQDAQAYAQATIQTEVEYAIAISPVTGPPPTPTPTTTACPPTRTPVSPSCPPEQGPNYVRNPYFEKFNRSWGEYSSTGREIVSTQGALEGIYSARLEGPSTAASVEILYQYLDIPPDATAASFWVENEIYAFLGGGGTPLSGRDYFRASLYDMAMSTELVRLWQFNPLSNCPIDPPSYNLTLAQLELIRGRTIALVFELRKYTTTGWQTYVIVDGIHFHVCSPSPPCRVEGNKTASPNVTQPGGEVTVMLSLTGLDGACLPQRQPADVMLVLDRSGSMSGQKIADAKAAAKGFLDRMDLSMDQVGLVSFSDAATLNQVLTQMAGPVRTAIDGLVASGATNITDAITQAQAELTSARHRTGNQPVIVLLSDGQPTAGGDPRPAATAAKNAGTRIFTIGLGADVDPNLLRDLASSPSDYFFAPTSSQLDAIYQQIAGAIAGSPATNITIVDRLSPYVTLVPNSFTGLPVPDVSPDGKTLTWRIPRLGLETRLWSYRVKMTNTAGTWPTNDSATATYTDSRGQPASLTFPIPYVTVLPPADKHPQIMCKDHATDNGAVPSNPNGEPWWASPDIWVRNNRDGGLTHQNPIIGQTNYVYVRVRNTGDATVNNITVHLYDSPGASNLRWPDDWVPEIGTATIASLSAGQELVVSVAWTPVVQGHYCFLVRIAAPDDRITFDGWVPFDNNICQRNVQIIGDGASTTGVKVGNRSRGAGYSSLLIKSNNIPTGGSAKVTFTDPAMFQRWQQAGGTVTGGQVISGTNSIQLDVLPLASGASALDGLSKVEATIDRLPFEGEETSQLKFEVTVPTGKEAPMLQIAQIVDGETVGGNVLQAREAVKIYLPLIMKKWVIWVPETPTPTPTATPGWITIVSTDFEGAFPSPWTVDDNDGTTNGEYYWAKRSCKAYAGSNSGWGVGGGANGAALACGSNYPDNADSWMIYGPFSLSGATAADLKFKLWLNSESDNDKVCRFASLNGSDFYGLCTSGNTNGWTDRVLDLSNVYTLGDLRGQPNVWVALVFSSNGSVNYPEGGYVDNIVLRKCTAASCPAGASTASDDAQTVDFPAKIILAR